MSIKINALEVENTKRVKAVVLEPTKDGLTIIGGKNEQGKTSVIDAICWALGGDKFKPTDPQNNQSENNPYIKITLSNGLIVERLGKNSTLKVSDPNGMKGTQGLLNSFIGQLALDLPQFMNSSNIEKAKTLLNVLGVKDELVELNNAEKETFNNRTFASKIVKDKKTYLEQLIKHEDVPNELISITDLIQKQQDGIKQNEENKVKLDQLKDLTEDHVDVLNEIEDCEKQIKALHEEITVAKEKADRINESIGRGKIIINELKEVNIVAINEEISNVETVNVNIRKNQAYKKASKEVESTQAEYKKLDDKINEIRISKKKLLAGAKLPLEGLTIENGELVYQGEKWDCMSSTGQLKVSVAIVRELYPDCGFVLMDKLEQFDKEQLSLFGDWLQEQGLQVIATRVSSDDECSVIIEDGKIKESGNN